MDEDRNALPEFIKQMQIGYPILWDKGGEKLTVQVNVVRLPTTLIVDRKGIVRHVHQGFYEALGREERAQIMQLLGECPIAYCRGVI